MRTMKLWRNILVMTAAMLSLASCSSDEKDGDWDPMVWKAEVRGLGPNGLESRSASSGN